MKIVCVYGFLLLHLLLCCRMNCVQSRASESNSTGHSTFNAPRNLHTHTPDRWNGMCAVAAKCSCIVATINSLLPRSTAIGYGLQLQLCRCICWCMPNVLNSKTEKLIVSSLICEWRPERKFFESCKHRMTVSVLPMKEVTTITTNCLCFDRNNDKTGEFEVW